MEKNNFRSLCLLEAWQVQNFSDSAMRPDSQDSNWAVRLSRISRSLYQPQKTEHVTKISLKYDIQTVGAERIGDKFMIVNYIFLTEKYIM